MSNSAVTINHSYRDAHQSTAAERAALSTEDLLPINLDIQDAATVMIGAWPKISALRTALQDELPRFDLAKVDKLLTYARDDVRPHHPLPRRVRPERAPAPARREGIALREFNEHVAALRAELQKGVDRGT